MGSIKSDTAKSTKKLAQQAAKQLAKEPFEILKGTGRQVVGAESQDEGIIQTQKEETTSQKDHELKEKEDKIRSKRLIEALENEIEDIRKQKKEEEEERLIAEEQEKAKESEEVSEEPQVTTKPSRRLKLGMKGKLDKLKKKSEIRLPPSG